MTESQLSFRVALLSGVEGNVTADASQKVVEVKSKILEALNLDAAAFSLFLDSAAGEEVKDDWSVADISGRSILAVVQSEPEWCTNKRFSKSYIRGRRCGLEETSVDIDLKIYAGGTFSYSKKHHDHDAECGYSFDSQVTATGKWKLCWVASEMSEVLQLTGESTKHESQTVRSDPGESGDEDDKNGENRDYDRTTTQAFSQAFSKAELTTPDKGRHAHGGWTVSALRGAG